MEREGEKEGEMETWKDGSTDGGRQGDSTVCTKRKIKRWKGLE